MVQSLIIRECVMLKCVCMAKKKGPAAVLTVATMAKSLRCPELFLQLDAAILDRTAAIRHPGTSTFQNFQMARLPLG